MEDLQAYVRQIAGDARRAASKLAIASGARRDAALLYAADAIRSDAEAIAAANQTDVLAAKDAGLSAAMIDRLTLTNKRIEAMATALESIARQPDPVGKSIAAYNRPNGLRVEKRRVPLGVVAIIYESRPNVTADAAGLCIKSGNAVILRGGKEALQSNLAIARCLSKGLSQADLPDNVITMIDRTEHEIVPALAQAEGLIDLIIPRGGESLIRAVVQAATIPVIKHYAGNCHIYVHADADLTKAERIILNAKCQRPGVCNAVETLLIDAAIAEEFLPVIAKRLIDAGVELRGCEKSCKIVPEMKPASQQDWFTEYLALILAVKVVNSLDEAIEHINT
ncbi:MAG: glutamate-5-semialdehyde dehydrogenase, partial [Planctomycetes bacterium]|nr:glutamate-5-semialdehyde dehydrogenase [Planctomycetota bacterium]